MANGKLGSAMSISSQWVKVYTVPAAGLLFSSVNINIVNMSNNAAKVRVAISTQDNPAPQDHIEFDWPLPTAGDTLNRDCSLMAPGEKVLVFADSDNLAIRVEGLEEEIQ